LVYGRFAIIKCCEVEFCVFAIINQNLLRGKVLWIVNLFRRETFIHLSKTRLLVTQVALDRIRTQNANVFDESIRGILHDPMVAAAPVVLRTLTLGVGSPSSIHPVTETLFILRAGTNPQQLVGRLVAKLSKQDLLAMQEFVDVPAHLPLQRTVLICQLRVYLCGFNSFICKFVLLAPQVQVLHLMVDIHELCQMRIRIQLLRLNCHFRQGGLQTA